MNSSENSPAIHGWEPRAHLPVESLQGRQKLPALRAFTLTELMIVVAVIAVLAGLLLPILAKTHAKSARAGCPNNLKQIGLAYRTWEGDYGDRYPQYFAGDITRWPSYADAKTTAVLAAPWNPSSTAQPSSQAWMVYYLMQNELNNPRIVLCPADTNRSRPSDFTNFANSNVSYFVGIDADESTPQAILSGDRNLVTNGVDVPTGFASIRTSDKLSWSAKIHNRTGNIGLADGSVQQTDNKSLQKLLQSTGTNLIRLAIP